MATIIKLSDAALTKAHTAVGNTEPPLGTEAWLEWFDAKRATDPVVFAAQRRYKTQCLPLRDFVPDPNAPSWLDAPELKVLLDKKRKRSTLRAELARYAATADDNELVAYLNGTGMELWSAGELAIKVEAKFIAALFAKAAVEGYVTLLSRYACRVIVGREPYGKGPASHTLVYLPLK